MAVACLLAFASRVDFRCRRIPNGCVAALCVAWAAQHGALAVLGVSRTRLFDQAVAAGITEPLANIFWLPSVPVGLVSAVVAVVILLGANQLYERIRGKQAMGLGDVKLIGALALFAGPMRLMMALALACGFALLGSLLARQRTFPFAPALTLGFACALLARL